MNFEKDLIVIKFGTASITESSGIPDESKIKKICSEVSQLIDKYRIVIVSSGAVGAGKNFVKNYKKEISQLKAAAAIGNPILISLYAKNFQPYSVVVAQSLCERQHFADRNQFLQLKSTYEKLWENNVITIANENDVVSDRELKFSDNDELATLIAVGFGAKKLMICTQSGGLLDKNKKIVKEVKSIDQEVLSYVDTSSSSLGLGGMSSKLTFTKLATQVGIETIIFGLDKNNGILSALNGESGTLFYANENNISAKNKWLASGGLTHGSIEVDKGAEEAIKSRKSLLAVGIKNFQGDFDEGEIVELISSEKQPFAVCRVKISSQNLGDKQKEKNIIIAHANDIALI